MTGSDMGTEKEPRESKAPTIQLPKGGGAIRGLDEKFSTNPVTGTGSMSVPIATSPGRSGFDPQLALSYDSGAGNGPFGLGWSLSLPSISRKTDDGLPLYRDAVESDVFILSGAEDLVPVPEDPLVRMVGGATYRIERYRPRIEGLFARIERWTNTAAATDVFWRSITRDNITTWYGRTAESRIADPLDGSRIFRWLICESHDDQGNAIAYGYKQEDSANLPAGAHERNRTNASRSVQRYPKRIRYGNHSPYFPALQHNSPWPQPQDAWLFEAVFDYGEHDADIPKPDDAGVWPVRQDPFSDYRPGFEVRTYRKCLRVLMFHHFPGEAGVEGDCLVRSTDFSYSADVDPAGVAEPAYTFLRSVTQTGYRRNPGGYDRRSLPPVEFEYSEPVVQDNVEQVDPQSLQNLPVGLDGGTYKWTDLHGEGIPGILTEQAGAWFYKRNLSPVPMRAQFAPLETVALKPNVALSEGAEFMDLAGDGLPDVVVMDGPSPGLYEHDEAEGWQPFRPFTSRLTHDLNDPNLRFVDLDGDGNTDVLVTEEDAIVWHASLGEDGFGPARRVAQALDEEKGPRVVFADGTQSIYLADLSGDGQTDIVRIRNGAICYWPNLGHGRFGAKVTMDNAPWFDHPDRFDHERVRLADVDGSGPTDIIYLHRDGVRLYFNQSGNGWSRPHHLKAFPHIDNAASIEATDLLGNGTACLVWSSPLPTDGQRQMRYVNLMGADKPHLLTLIHNNLGTQTRIRYAPSTKFYLLDKRNGTPWITRLPFPVHVVERVETYDHISRNRFVSRYAYHHGFFDGTEREFRGFGMVEQWDTEAFEALDPAANLDAASHVPPVHTKTWFHTGVCFGRDRVSDYLRGEYFREPGLTDAEARELLLPDTVLPGGLTAQEEREACRALKGSMLRQEVYADDAGPRASTPYVVTEQNFTVRTVQPLGANRHAVFLAHPREAINYHYERDPADPRVQHRMTMEVDPFGNVLKKAEICYGRRAQIRVVDAMGGAQTVPNPGLAALSPPDRAKQTTPLLTYTETRVSNAVESPDAHRNPLRCEAITFELTGYAATGAASRFQVSDLTEPDPVNPGRLRQRFTAPEVPYEATATGNQRRRRIEWLRTLLRRDDLAGLLPLGVMQPLALPGEHYQLALTPGLLAQVFKRPHQGQPAEALLPDPVAVLGGQAGYRRSQDLFPASGDADDHWWKPLGQIFYSTDPTDTAAIELAHARQHFFLPRRYRDPFGHNTFVDFDAHDLLMAETRDALGNRARVVANDYRVLQPRLVSDPNRNRTEIAFDTLGMVVGTAVMGKPPPAPAEGDTLTGFTADLTQLQLDGFFGAADPHTAAAALLNGATTRIIYDLDRFRRTRNANPSDPAKWQPACAATLARETHATSAQPLKIQLSFSYSDGFGREIQKKLQAEPGPAVDPRWVGSGWTIFNNKSSPVRQYEPFFSATHDFEFGVTAGVSPVQFYDPNGRLIATLNPDHTYQKVVFDPWRQASYDANDTCAARNSQTGDPRTDPDIGGYVAGYFAAQPATWQTWHAQRIGGGLGPDESNAAQRAQAHADTPSIDHFDVLGRPFLAVESHRVVCPGHDLDGAEDVVASRIELDIEGNQRAVRDALDRIVVRYAYDMLGNRIHQLSMDAGARWTLSDVAGKPIRAWDSCGHNFTIAYDALRRSTEQTVRGTNGDSDPRTLNHDIVFHKIEYGESQANAETLNLRGRVYRNFDSAGVATNAYDFKGNTLRSTRRLVTDYKAIPDWQAGPALDAETFEGSTTFDALNRPVQTVAPHSSLAHAKRNVIQPVFNEANLIERIDVWLERDAEPATLLDPGADPPSPVAGVTGIDYDAKGQRVRIDYKNGAGTSYDYDPLTFRLTRLLTRRVTTSLQDHHYTYDPAGNLTHVRDEAQQTVYFGNQLVEPSNDYVYDSLYRLVQATGREHLGQLPGGERKPPTAPDGFNAFHTRLNHPGDGNAMGTYVERYVYDAVGNFLQMQHRGGSPAHPGWTRGYDYLEPSLIEDGDNGTQLKTSNRLSRTMLDPLQIEPYQHDPHGNMVRMPHLGAGQPGRNLHYDFKDQLDRVELGGGGTAHYVYDASGQRVRKVWEKAPGLVEERIYLGGFEIFRKHNGPIGANTTSFERETLHVMDDKQRIALVETRTLDTAMNDPAPRQLIRYQIGNHLGSASVELDEQARIISYEEHAPFGSTTYQAVRSQTEAPKRYRYTGKERDEESGFYYHGARYCAPWLGRWVAPDPLGLIDGLNVFAYVGNEPVLHTDPYGTDKKAPENQSREASVFNPRYANNFKEAWYDPDSDSIVAAYELPDKSQIVRFKLSDISTEESPDRDAAEQAVKNSVSKDGVLVPTKLDRYTVPRLASLAAKAKDWKEAVGNVDLLLGAMPKLVKIIAMYGGNGLSKGPGTAVGPGPAARTAARVPLVQAAERAAVGQIANSGSDLARAAIAYRVSEGATGGNIAVAEFRNNAGKLETILKKSGEGYKHAEVRILEELKRRGIDPKSVERIYTELAPCTIKAPGANCAAKIASAMPNAKITFSYPYGSTKAARAAGVDMLKEAIEGLKRFYGAGGKP
ncbi:MAG TPA: SpvB/TcaC N-terminal domain-containing protein [Candidatus Limnocylindrales bacterium]